MLVGRGRVRASGASVHAQSVCAGAHLLSRTNPMKIRRIVLACGIYNKLA